MRYRHPYRGYNTQNDSRWLFRNIHTFLGYNLDVLPETMNMELYATSKQSKHKPQHRSDSLLVCQSE